MTAAPLQVDCSVLVPVLNEQDHISASVAAMQRQRFPGQVEFLIVDGRSTDGTPALLAELARGDSRIRLLENPRRAIPSGLNVGLGHARGRWVARMDAHAEYPEDYLQRGVQRLIEGGTRWVSGPQRPEGEGGVGHATALALKSRIGRGASGRWSTDVMSTDGEQQLDTGVFCGVWERETLIEYGGWDERWARNEDSELAARFLTRGERLVSIPEMAAKYAPRGSLLGLWRQYFANGEYRVQTARRHPGSFRRSNFLPAGLVLAATAAVSAPRTVRAMSRVALGAYGAAVMAAATTASRREASPTERALVPVVLVVMHLAYGVGSLRGVLRHGAPLAALASAVGFSRLAARIGGTPDAVFAPSLDEALAAAANCAPAAT